MHSGRVPEVGTPETGVPEVGVPEMVAPGERELLRVEHVSVRFGGIQALDDVSLRVRTGSLHGLIGPNGAGKTTLFNVITGLAKPAAGRVAIGGRDVTGTRPHRRARLGMARTFQRLELFTSLSVRENVQVAADAARPIWRRQRGAASLVASALERVGLADAADERVDELPIGTARLVELARAIATTPRVLLLDEPASGLDREDTASLGELLVGLARDGLAVLLVEHDMSLVMGQCDSISVMDAGRVIASGTAAQVQSSQIVRDAYLGVAAGGSAT
jgi:branched-chain amino acid transport system ATP-binding protein